MSYWIDFPLPPADGLLSRAWLVGQFVGGLVWLWGIFCFVLFFETRFLCVTLPYWILLYRPGWPRTQRSACLCLWLHLVFLNYRITIPCCITLAGGGGLLNLLLRNNLRDLACSSVQWCLKCTKHQVWYHTHTHTHTHAHTHTHNSTHKNVQICNIFFTADLKKNTTILPQTPLWYSR